MVTRSYLSKAKMNKAAASRKTMFIAGGIIAGIFALMFPMAFTSNPELKGNLPTYAVCILPGLLLIWRGFVISRQMDMATRFDSVFACDRDGYVTLGELTKQTGKGEQETLNLLETLFQKGYFEHCTLHRTGRAGVELTDAADGDNGQGFVTVQCENCGGTSRIRAGAYGKCEYCGAPIHSEIK